MKLAAGCSKHCFKVVDGTDEVSSKHKAEKQLTYHGKATLTKFELDFRRV
ncbi:chlorohydrolase [Streptococcus pneumoniae]|nr:chlorohydrolase [Streptococcus pneumoniae]